MGKDVFAIALTGVGKSAFMQAVVIADLAEGKESLAFTIVPTKTLADDQVCTTLYSIMEEH